MSNNNPIKLEDKLNNCSTAKEMLITIINNVPSEILEKPMGFVTKAVFISGLSKALTMLKFSK
jgi:hypothetical protein